MMKKLTDVSSDNDVTSFFNDGQKAKLDVRESDQLSTNTYFSTLFQPNLDLMKLDYDRIKINQVFCCII